MVSDPKKTLLVEDFKEVSSDAQMSSPCFVQYSGTMLGRRYDIDKDEMLIGRDPSCEVFVKDESTVSRTHALLQKRGSDYFLSDKGSTNGTYINKDRITETKLKDGDLVRLGSVVLLKYFSRGNIERVFLDKIYKMAIIDALTQIYNKKYFLEQLQSEVSNSFAYERDLCLLLFDIDHFKKVNDKYGHQAGDFILAELCKVVQKTVRERDIFARYGGEEFVMILPDTELEPAYQLAERIRAAVESHQFEFGEDSIPITVSIGVKLLTSEMTANKLIEDTDKNLYASKKAGRNRVTK